VQIGAGESGAEQKKVIQDERDNHDWMVALPGAR
jgi:hypothetical protein